MNRAGGRWMCQQNEMVTVLGAWRIRPRDRIIHSGASRILLPFLELFCIHGAMQTELAKLLSCSIVDKGLGFIPGQRDPNSKKKNPLRNAVEATLAPAAPPHVDLGRGTFNFINL